MAKLPSTLIGTPNRVDHREPSATLEADSASTVGSACASRKTLLLGVTSLINQAGQQNQEPYWRIEETPGTRQRLLSTSPPGALLTARQGKDCEDLDWRANTLTGSGAIGPGRARFSST